jgi:DNA-binding XRE family transcriptional regulator
MTAEEIQGELLQNDTAAVEDFTGLHPLRAYRRRHRLTLDAMATKAGLSLRAICNYEKLDRYPKPENVEKIVAATGGEVTAQDLHEAWNRGKAA